MKFRGIPAKGWIIIGKPSSIELSRALNEYMEDYDFLDCQFSVDARNFYALVLLGEKSDERVKGKERVLRK